MVIVTEAAQQALKALVESRQLASGRFIRLATQPVWQGEGDFGLVIDDEREGDQAFYLEGLKILIVEPGIAAGVERAILDYKQSGAGARFTVDIYGAQATRTDTS